ncbi:hypothetical protein [Streptomyces sp. NBC_01497]|nr:hypothetical protein [Streptomyces sp. NBC_01497]
MVERCFNRLKQFRAIATRFDKLASAVTSLRPTGFTGKAASYMAG